MHENQYIIIKKKKNVRGQNAFKGRTKLREVRRAYEQV